MPVFIILLLSLSLCSAPALQPASSAAARPSFRGTIDRCLKELKNPDQEIRRSAALVLGKYPGDPFAFQGLLDCLKDKDAEIRQSALVSLTEGTFIRPAVRPYIYPMFQDPDVHIRRIATSLLRNLSVRRYGYFLGQHSGNSGDRQTQNQLARKHAELALEDSDYSVRRNILAGGVYQPDLINTEKLLPFFKDDQDEMVILALQIYRNKPGSIQEKISQLTPLCSHGNPDIRHLAALQLLQTVSGSSKGETSRQILEILRRLYRDSSPKVRIVAIRGMLLTGNDELLPRMPEILLDKSLPGHERCSLVPFLRQFGDRSLPVLQTLLKCSQPALREEAMRVLALYPREVLSDEELIRTLSDENPSIRRQAVALLRRRRHVFQEQELRQLLRSPHADLRDAVLQLIPGTQPHLLKEAVLELCMDDDIQIRCRALRRLPAVRPQDWTEILTASLDDENAEIQETAAQCLLNLRNPEILEALKNYLPRCRNAYLKHRLQLKLSSRR